MNLRRVLELTKSKALNWHKVSEWGRLSVPAGALTSYTVLLESSHKKTKVVFEITWKAKENLKLVLSVTDADGKTNSYVAIGNFDENSKWRQKEGSISLKCLYELLKVKAS